MPEVGKKLESPLDQKGNQEKILPKQEQPESVEREPEKILEKSSISEENQEQNSADQGGGVSNAVPAGPVADRLQEAIDDILEEGLEDLYLNMSSAEQTVFKKKGEETTSKIVFLLTEAKVKVKKIVQIIIEWLKMISGVNKFFIRQTAKIKTDKILEAKNQTDSEFKK